MSEHQQQRAAEFEDDVPMPRWVKAFAWVAALLILVFVVSHLMGGGMGRHMGPADAVPAAEGLGAP